MATIKRFEDIAGWKKGRELTRQIYQITNEGAFGKDWSFQSQIRRSSVSIMANIAEGFERGGDKVFRNFLSIARGSAAEVRSHLYVAFDARYIDQSTFERLYALAQDASNLIGGFMNYLAQCQDSQVLHSQGTSDCADDNPPTTQNDAPRTQD